MFRRKESQQPEPEPARPERSEDQDEPCTDMLGIPNAAHSPNRRGVCTTCGQPVRG